MQPHMVMFLFHRGADMKAVDKDGDTVLHFACMKQFDDSSTCHNQTLRILLTAKVVCPNRQNLAGDTPLMTALRSVGGGFPLWDLP